MNSWKYSFDQVSKTDWLRQMQKDLKEKPLESIHSEWWPGETLYPAMHAEDREFEPVFLPDYLFTNPPRLIERIGISNQKAEDVNSIILQALQFGAESLVLIANNIVELSFDLWLKNVVKEIVEINFLVSGSTSFSSLNAVPQDVFIQILRDKNDGREFFKSLNQESVSNVRFNYNLPATGDWIHAASLTFQQMLDDLAELKNLGFDESSIINQQVVQFEPDKDYLKQIIQTRVIHVIWQNLFSQIAESGRTRPRYLECLILNHHHSSPEQFLIINATSCLAASLSGVHGLCIHNPEGDFHPAFFDRNNRNIHHLLNMESEIYSGSDPIGGSYAIDFYTRKWSEAIWNNLKR